MQERGESLYCSEYMNISFSTQYEENENTKKNENDLFIDSTSIESNSNWRVAPNN